MLELIPAERLVRLGITLRSQRLPEIEDKISEITDDADLDEDPESLFEKIANALTKLEDLNVDDEGSDLIDDARTRIRRSIEYLEERKEERDNEDDSDADWSHIVTTSPIKGASPPMPTEKTTRSIFDDVDCS